MQVSVSTGCLYQLAPVEFAAVAADAGFRHVEALLNTALLADLDGVARAFSERGLATAVVHAPFELDGLLSDPDRADDAREVGRRALDACVALGAPLLTVHPGASPALGLPRARRIEVALASLDALQASAEARGVELLVENTQVYYLLGIRRSGLLGNDPGEMEAFTGPADCPIRRMTFDTSHASTLREVSIPDFIRTMGPRIANLHLSDAAGTTDHLPIGRGRIEFRSVFEALRAVGFDGNATLELRPQHSTVEELRRHRVLVETELGRREAGAAS